MVKTLLETLNYEYVASLINETNNYSMMASAPDKPCTCGSPTTPSSANSKGSTANALIIAGAAAGGMKLAQKMPGAGTKVLCVCGGILAGGLGIAVTNVTNNLTENLGKSKFISNSQIMDILKDIVPLTGNDALDLLNIIQCFQRLQFLFIILICYIIIFTHINLVKLESFLSKFLPAIIVRWYVRSMSLYQKSSLIFLICFIILLSFCNFYAIHSLEFFIENWDGIINLYSKK